VSPEDQNIAAIDGLAKTLRTNIPPQLHDNTVDKLQELQDILQPRPDGGIKSIPLQTPVQVPRVRTPYEYAPDHSPVQTPNATALRVAMNHAIPPRVAPVETNGDATEFVYPKRDMWNKQKTRPVKPTSPRQSPRLEALQKQSRVADAGQLCTVSTPAQNTRSKTAGNWPTGKGHCKVTTIKQELVLACIKTYTEVTQKPAQASSLAQHKFPSKILNAVLNKDPGELMEMRQLLRNPKYSNLWGKSYTKELRRLAQGIPGTKGTDTILFIKYDKIPLDRRQNVTYGKTVVMYWPEKDDPNRTRLTVGGNQIVCPFNASTPTVKMMTVKMHLNSLISTKGAHYCTIDLKDFYLNTPMERPEYMQLKLSDLPHNFVDMYDLIKIAEDNGNVYIKIQKGMYSLPQAGILAHQLLKQWLNEHGYEQSQITPGLWKHTT
jgi:hypothetical protein